MDAAIKMFQGYMGTGLTMLWFMVGVIYLFIKEKRPTQRILFVYMPIIVLLIFFNPLSAGVIMERLDMEIYYRLLWVLPITVLLSYIMTDVCDKIPTGYKTGYICGMICLTALSGRLIYTNPEYSFAENPYHIPQAVIEICDRLEDYEHENFAVFPRELLQYVRQYSGNIVLQYGREVIVDRWGNYNELFEIFDADVVEPGKMWETEDDDIGIKKYLVIEDDKELAEPLEQYDLLYLFSLDEYDVYANLYWIDYEGRYPFWESLEN